MFAKGIGMSILDAMAAGIAERGHVAWESLTEGEKIAARETVRAALGAAEALGWKLVPVEPTPEMVMAGGDIELESESHFLWEENALACYRAMLAASPSIEENKP